MGATALVIVLVGAGESGSDWAAGMQQALREALDRAVVIDVREQDDNVAAPEDAYVVFVDFSNGKPKALLVPRQPAGRPSKEVSFKRTDRPLDRGRALGYALGALLPELRADAIGPDVSASSPIPTLHSFLAVADYLPGPKVAAPPQIVLVQASPTIIQVTPGRVSLEAAALGAGVGYGGLATGVSIGAEVSVGKGLLLRADGHFLFGGSPLPGADLRRLSAQAGFRFAALARGPVTLSLFGHIVALRLEMSRASETEGRWVPAAQGGLDLSFTLSRVALFIAPAFQWSFGPTAVYVHDVAVAVIPERLYQLGVGLRGWP